MGVARIGGSVWAEVSGLSAGSVITTGEVVVARGVGTVELGGGEGAVVSAVARGVVTVTLVDTTSVAVDTSLEVGPQAGARHNNAAATALRRVVSMI